eukprot:7727784-Lingulodinium_polyedra.AAC.1
MEEQGEGLMVDYLRRWVFEESDGLVSAKWLSSPDSCPPGFSTYTSNCIESFWAKLDAQHPSDSQLLDVSYIVAALEEDVVVLQRDAALAELVHKPTSAQRSLLQGEGLMCARSGLYAGQHR